MADRDRFPLDRLLSRLGVASRAEAPAIRRYALWHKPRGVVVSARDERGRPDLATALPPKLAGCVAAGRLDLDSEGLLLLTDDGAFADAAVAPGRHPKRYRVTFDAEPSDAQLEGMAKGGSLGRGIEAGPCEVRRSGPREGLFILHEGRNRQIRRLAEREGLAVIRLVREALGPVELGDLPAGGWRWLTEGEIMEIQSPSTES